MAQIIWTDPALFDLKELVDFISVDSPKYSEFDRVISWRKKDNPEYAEKAFDRTLELLDLTIADLRWRGPGLKELTRVREIICDALLGENEYTASAEYLSGYFLQFAIAARRNR